MAVYGANIGLCKKQKEKQAHGLYLIIWERCNELLKNRQLKSHPDEIVRVAFR
jgi:hypothetical protein